MPARQPSPLTRLRLGCRLRARAWRALGAAAFLALVLPLAAAAAVDPANIHFNLALKQYQAQRLDEASASLAKALAVSPSHPQANLLSGIIACQQGRFQEAIAPLKLATDKLPGNADAFNNLGVAQFRLGRLDEAEAAFKKVQEISPGRADVALNLGVLELRLSRPQQALAQFRIATEADPGNGQAWLGLAEAADALGDRAQGTEARAKALGAAPDDKALRLDVGQRLYQAGRITEAAQALAPLQGKGEAPAEFIMGVLAYRSGDFELSRKRFEDALALKPDYPEARFNLAITLYDQGRYEGALEQFQEVLKAHPDDEEARKNLDITRQTAVRSSLKQGSQEFLKADYRAALASWNRALALEPENKVVRDLADTAQAQLMLQADELAAKAGTAWAAGKKEEAILAWTQALERVPDLQAAKDGLASAQDDAQRLAQAYRQSAETALSDGRWEQARSFAARVQSIDKIMGDLLVKQVEETAKRKAAAERASAEGAQKRGALSAQIDALERAVQAQPGDDAAQMALNQAKANMRQAVDRAVADAQSLEKEGRPREAAKFYRLALSMNPEHSLARASLKRVNVGVASRVVDPAVVDDLYYQGVYAYAAGNTVKAESFWKKAVDMDPKHALAQEALSRSQKRYKALKKR